ncbi:hypothetical protein IWQ62_002195 [Dispira parvispora]|uniref:PHD-type domain-containing protein n=1 Tax=Dispira parvispora TaxID=1520584 RepID=A0A9W8AQU2_9FUNG|nr:hypothetical protein IWQ62_002195 [Dispira parvispora]
MVNGPVADSPTPTLEYILERCSGEDDDSWSNYIQQKYDPVRRTASPKSELGHSPLSALGTKTPTGKITRSSTKPLVELCETCQGDGRIVCCDACPRVFHFLCLNPPLSEAELSRQDKWYCAKCQATRQSERPTRTPKKRKAHGMFDSLISNMNQMCPKVFSLPRAIFEDFEGVSANAEGEYTCSTGKKASSTSRSNTTTSNGTQMSPIAGDKNQMPIHQCHHCHRGDHRLPLLACDYCPLWWHLECLDPPLTIPPSSHRKWMCPNHADHVTPSFRRWKKTKQINLTDPRLVRNAGQIVVDNDDDGEELRLMERLQADSGPELFPMDPLRSSAKPFHSLRAVMATSRHNLEFRVPATHIKGTFCAAARARRRSAKRLRHTESRQLLSDKPFINGTGPLMDTGPVGLPLSQEQLEWLQNVTSFQKQVAHYMLDQPSDTRPIQDESTNLNTVAASPKDTSLTGSSSTEGVSSAHGIRALVRAALGSVDTWLSDPPVSTTNLTKSIPSTPRDTPLSKTTSPSQSPSLANISACISSVPSTTLDDPYPTLPTPSSISQPYLLYYDHLKKEYNEGQSRVDSKAPRCRSEPPSLITHQPTSCDKPVDLAHSPRPVSDDPPLSLSASASPGPAVSSTLLPSSPASKSGCPHTCADCQRLLPETFADVSTLLKTVAPVARHSDVGGDYPSARLVDDPWLVQSLRALQQLMRIKGENALVNFLLSDSNVDQR